VIIGSRTGLGYSQWLIRESRSQRRLCKSRLKGLYIAVAFYQ
jgi:hypothetical protein